jgi:hypothetical protein
MQSHLLLKMELSLFVQARREAETMPLTPQGLVRAG